MSHQPAIAKNARLGLVLFFIYLLLYGTFVYLSAFDAAFMAATAFAGVNVAIIYGFGLIASAFVLALIYLRLCYPVHEPTDREPHS